MDHETEITIDDVMDMIESDEYEALDGCPVEPDGTCEHESPSALVAFGMI